MAGPNTPTDACIVCCNPKQKANLLKKNYLIGCAEGRFGTACAQSHRDSNFVEMSRTAVTVVAQRERRDPAQERAVSSACRRPGLTARGASRVAPSPAVRLLRPWQQRGAEFRTDASAPPMTGLTLKGMCWLDTSPRRCHNSVPAVGHSHTGFSRKLAAAREPAVVSIRETPNILSAIDQQVCRQSPPCLLPGGGDRFHQIFSSVRPTRTVSPKLGNQQSFRRTHSALSGATGVDPSTGAAVH